MEEIQTLDLPSHLFKKKTAFAYDHGSSLFKIVYSTDEGDFIRLHFRSFAKDDVDEGIQFLKQHFGQHCAPENDFHVTGVNADKNKKKIEQALNLKLTIASEGHCVLYGTLLLLKKFPLQNITYEKSETARQHGIKAAAAMKASFQPLVDKGRLQNWKSFEHEEVEVEDAMPMEFPFLAVHLGSTVGYLRVDEDGMRLPTDFHPTAGKALYGLGSLVTGSKSFKELNHLVDRGCLDSTYYVQSSDSDHERVDMAAKVVRMVAKAVTMPCMWPCYMYDIKHIIFTGGLVSGCPGIREEIAKILEEQKRANIEGVKVDFHFLKYAGYVGAVGSLIKSLEMVDE